MRCLLTLICLNLSFFSFAQSSLGLVAHWPMNGNAHDTTGNGHNGIIHNVISTTGINGQPGTAMEFAGNANSFIDVPYQTDMNVAKYTICTILKPEEFYTGLCQSSFILCRGNNTSAGHYDFQLFDNAFDSSCAITGDTSHFVFAGSGGISNPWHKPWQYAPTTQTNQWYNVIITFDNTTFKVYVNGVLKSVAVSQNAPITIGTSTDNISIGNNQWGGPQYPYWLKGAIDDLRLYNRVLADSEIVQYNLQAIRFNQPFTDTVLCIGKTTPIHYNSTGIFNSGNVFTLQLSDSGGSFTTPTVIGSVFSGSIPGNVPASAPAGKHYKMRIISSTPAIFSDTVNVSLVQPLPVSVHISANPGTTAGPFVPILFTGNITNGGSNPTFQWKKNGINIAGATNLIYTGTTAIDFSNNDKISLSVVSSLPCVTSGHENDTQTIHIDLGIEDAKENALAVYPNPNNGCFTIIYNTVANQHADLEIFDVLGRYVCKDQLEPGNNKSKKINLDGRLGKGLYIIRVKTDVGNRNIKFKVL